MSSQILEGSLKDNLRIKKMRSYYTPSQAVQWLARIGLDLGITQDDLEAGTVPTSLETLRDIVRRSLLTFPFENTDMHYTLEHKMDISPESLFDRMVVNGAGGSYCFGLNGLLFGMLRTLGYRAYSGAARVNSAQPNESLSYTNLSHQIIFVQPTPDSNQTYLVDVGFGIPGLAQPILLSTDDSNVALGVDKTEKHRLTRSVMPLSSFGRSGESPEFKWNLEVYHEKNDSPNDGGWRILYTFSEEEFFFQDYRAASFVVSTMPDPRGIFWNNVICVKHFVLDPVAQVIGLDTGKDVEAEKPMYRLFMVGKEVKRNMGGHTEVLRTMRNEQERIQILRDLFGVHVEDTDAAHIAGRQPAF
ncbi:arylamine N-acetyltransferase 2 [Panaeolus papilionaceus]|nr:arylamine N-acetyltransferase 2 [Panaeolus papilionaceus]